VNARFHRRRHARRQLAVSLLVAVALVLGACAGPSPEPTAPIPSGASGVPTEATLLAQPTPVTTTVGAATADAAGMPNPASVYCVESGGSLEIRTDAGGGQYGVCVFADGSECEEWAFFRRECQPGQSGTAAAPASTARYSNDTYGFSLDAPNDWTIEGETNHVLFKQGDYALFVGFKRADEEVGPFRTGMPSGEFVAGGMAALLGQDLPKRLLVEDGKTKVVEYAPGIGVGDLRLYIWLDATPTGGDYRAVDIPGDVVAAADAIVASFALASGLTPELRLTPESAP
jgi:putative hemolysin